MFEYMYQNIMII